ERDLAMADLFAIGIGLENAIDWGLRVIVHRGAVGAAPHTAIAESHAAGIGAVRDHGLENLAGLEVQQPGLLLFAVMALLLHPEAIGGIHRNAIGPARRR